MAPRVVQEEEWERARDARLRALADSPSAFLMTLSEEEGLDEHYWRERVRPTDERVWLAQDEGDRFVGIVVVAFAEPDRELASIFSTWVEPAERGRGIGRLLVEAALEWASARGAARAELEVNERMEAARRLYESCGFVPTGRTRALPTDPGAKALQMECDTAR
jgi:ribosomal protein S18 acetylase RimI-like enzyme